MDTRLLYNKEAKNWHRDTPKSLSDFTGRPALLELCGEVSGLKVLDAGCGEGYVARLLANKSAKVTGVDLSDEMIRYAKHSESQKPLNIRYAVQSITSLLFGNESFDLVVCVFVFNYLNLQQTSDALREIFRVLKPGGRCIFSVPHPVFSFMHRDKYPMHFDVTSYGYFTARDRLFPGKIFCIDGIPLPVQMNHKTIEDYFDLLRNAGFERMPIVRELKAEPQHVDAFPDLFGSIMDVPLHLAISVER